MTIALDDVAALVALCNSSLGPRDTWSAPAGYPDSLALCAIDAIWSIGVRYQGVVHVLDRYRALRQADDAAPDSDSPADLLASIAAAGGPDGFAAALKNRQRTSSRGGILKAEAVRRVASVLRDQGVCTPVDVRALPPESLADLKRAWRTVPGQHSGVSWRYFLLLAGLQEVKPDRMIIGFVEAAIGRLPTAAEAGDLVTAAAAHLDVALRTLDHRIWRHQSGRD